MAGVWIGQQLTSVTTEAGENFSEVEHRVQVGWAPWEVSLKCLAQ